MSSKMDRQGMLMNREHLHRRQNKMGISLDEYNLGELQELLAAIDREIEARSFADSLEAQLRLFMRRRGQ